MSPRTSLPGSFQSGHFGLLLRLPWLYDVNAHISIRESKITIGDPAVGETMRDIIGTEMVFCSKHTLLMYPKNFLSPEGLIPEEESSTDKAEDGSSDDELSDAEEMPVHQDFP